MKKRLFALLLSALILTHATACLPLSKDEGESSFENTSDTEESLLDEPMTDSDVKFGTYEEGMAAFAELSYLYKSVLNGTRLLYHVGTSQEMYLEDCRFPYFQTQLSEASKLYFSVVEAEGDGADMAVVVTDGDDSIVLHAYAGCVYAYDFTFRGMYHLQENGVYHWTANAGLTYGSNKLCFVGKSMVNRELTRVEHDKENTNLFSCYINQNPATHEELLAYEDQTDAERAVRYPMILENSEPWDNTVESILPSDIPANAELIETGTCYRIWRGSGDFYFYYHVFDTNGNTVLCGRTQRPLKIAVIEQSILDITVSFGTGNSTLLHRFYDSDTNRLSQIYNNVEAIFGELVVFSSQSILKKHLLNIKPIFDPSPNHKTYEFDFASVDPALESPIKSMELCENGKAILLSYLAGEESRLTYSRIPLEQETYIPDEKISADFANYDSIIHMYQKMVETTPLFYYSTWGKSGILDYDSLFEIPNETAKEWYTTVLNAVLSHDIQDDHFYQYGYTVTDLNNDGIDELILRQYNHRVLAVFSMVDGKPVLLGGYRARYSCWIDPNGLLRVHGSSGAAYFHSCVYQVANGGGELILLEEHGCDGYDESTGTLLYYKVVDGEKVPLTEAEKKSGVITRKIPKNAGGFKVYYENAYGIWTHPLTRFL